MFVMLIKTTIDHIINKCPMVKFSIIFVYDESGQPAVNSGG